VSNPVVPPPSEPAPMDADPATGHAYLPPAPEERPSLRRKLLKALGVVVALIVVLVVKTVWFGDEARTAEVGDCIAASKAVSAQSATEAEVEVVDCGATQAAYVVVGKVVGTSDMEGNSCDHYFKEGEQFVVYGSKSSTGEFLLCMRPRP
jgi:hypothetical protein